MSYFIKCKVNIIIRIQCSNKIDFCAHGAKNELKQKDRNDFPMSRADPESCDRVSVNLCRSIFGL
jgi:hypothetical protein